jgi:hypothetical protein
VTAQAAGVGNVIATPVTTEEDDPMEVQFESAEPVETPGVQEALFDHTFCTESTDVYARVCSCRQCWASKCRGL